MKKAVLVVLLLVIMILFTGCEALFFFWAMRNWTDIEDSWNGPYPLEEGTCLIFESDISVYEKVDGVIVDTQTYSRRDSVVVWGEDELSDSRLAIHVIDYWTCNGDSGEIHHYYIQQSGDLYNLAMRYKNGNGMNFTNDSSRFRHFIELSPLPGHSIMREEDFSEDAEILETSTRKVLTNYYYEDMVFSGSPEWGDFLDKCEVGNHYVTYRIWDNCLEIDKRYWLPDTWNVRLTVEDYLCGDGIVKRTMDVDYREILDAEGNDTGVYKKFVARFWLVDGTYMN